MNRAQIVEALTPHAKRPIRAFLQRPGDGAAEEAFWHAVYANTPSIEHTEAKALAEAMERSDARVSTIIEGLAP
jgi:hypothetical protein